MYVKFLRCANYFHTFLPCNLVADQCSTYSYFSLLDGGDNFSLVFLWCFPCFTLVSLYWRQIDWLSLFPSALGCVL